MSTLRVNNLVKKFKSRTVVDDVSFDVHSGEVVGLLGPNGAGKTTSFYMVVGLVQADEGTIHLDDKNLTQLPMHARAKQGIGYLPQEASIFRKLSVEDNIMAVLEAKKEFNAKQRQEKMDALIDDLQVDHIRKNTGLSLSGGERRRVEIACWMSPLPALIQYRLSKFKKSLNISLIKILVY
jgi:lipopolysaccharide export system ATP-binding protein